MKKAKDQPESEPAELASLVGERIRKIRKEEGLGLELFALPAKEKQGVPDGERPVVHIAIVCGFWQGASGWTHPVFVLKSKTVNYPLSLFLVAFFFLMFFNIPIYLSNIS